MATKWLQEKAPFYLAVGDNWMKDYKDVVSPECLRIVELFKNNRPEQAIYEAESLLNTEFDAFGRYAMVAGLFAKGRYSQCATYAESYLHRYEFFAGLQIINRVSEMRQHCVSKVGYYG